MTSSPPDDLPSIPLGCPTGWLASLSPFEPGAELHTLQLAWLGDAVWELHQRLLHCQSPGRPADLHNTVVGRVRAEAQALALERLKPHLSPQEQDLVRRGRNRAGRGSRRQAASLYGQATGFETMVGWLFLRDPRRLAVLLDHLEQTNPLPSPADDHEPLPE